MVPLSARTAASLASPAQAVAAAHRAMDAERRPTHSTAQMSKLRADLRNRSGPPAIAQLRSLVIVRAKPTHQSEGHTAVATPSAHPSKSTRSMIARRQRAVGPLVHLGDGSIGSMRPRATVSSEGYNLDRFTGHQFALTSSTLLTDHDLKHARVRGSGNDHYLWASRINRQVMVAGPNERRTDCSGADQRSSRTLPWGVDGMH